MRRRIDPTATPVRAQRPRTLTDTLLDRAKAIYPDLSMEMRGKIDMLLNHTNASNVVDWGKINLLPLQMASNEQSKIAGELVRIDATGALNDTKNAALRPPSFIGKLSGKTPEHYEKRLSLIRGEIVKILQQTTDLLVKTKIEVDDLHHDCIAMVVTHPEWTDSALSQLGNSRAKTLMQAHQTGLMVLQTLENYVSQCALSIEQIDSMLTTTLPQWKLSRG